MVSEFLGKNSYNEYVGLCDKMDYAATLYAINELYPIVVQFVEWFNKQKTQSHE